MAFEDYDGQMHRHMIHLPNEDVDKILNTGIMVTVQFIMLKAERAMQGKLPLILAERKSVRRLTVKPNALLRISCLNIVFRQKQDFLTNPITQLSMSLPKR